MKRILRDTSTTPSSETSPNPNPHKQRSTTPRKPKSSKENAPPLDPNSLPDPHFASPSMSSKSKTRSPLPPRPPLPSNPLKRKLLMETVPEHSPLSSSDSGVQVIVRMRPPIKEDDEEVIIQKVTGDSLSVLGQTFTFDSVADTESTQQDIFQLVGAPLVENCLAGFNSSIFAYGQTGSGKTYTMWGPANALLDENLASSQKGLTPRVFERLFARIEEEQVKNADKQLQYQCRCSFLEIYNEQITDLLDPTQGNLQIREDVRSGVYVENLTEEYVCTMKDVIQLLVKGLSNRRTGATSINAESSRSHCVFTCVVESQCKSMADGLSSIRSSRINLVDLAGSERQKLTGAAGERLKEAGNINRSLSQLGNLINILAEVSQSGKQRHIPYRDSRLTFLLQESLGGNAKLAMICAISPVQSCKSETFSTLRFAQRAKAIKNKAVVNEVTQEDVKVLREVIRQLKDELLRMKENGNPNSDGGYSTSWNARRSLNLLKLSLNRPMALAHIEEDSDEEMEIDEEAVERLSARIGFQPGGQEHSPNDGSNLPHVQADSEVSSCQKSTSTSLTVSSFNGGTVCGRQQCVDPSQTAHGSDQHSEETQVIVGKSQQLASDDVEKCGSCLALNNPTCATSDYFNHQNLEESNNNADLLNSASAGEVDKDSIVTSDCEMSSGGPAGASLVEKPSESPSGIPKASLSSLLGTESSEVSPPLHSPTLSVSPIVNSSSRKSLKTSSMLSASQKNLGSHKHIDPEVLHLSFAKPFSRNSLSDVSSKKNSLASSDQLAVSLHRGLQIIDSCRQSSVLRRSSFRFSYKPVDVKSLVEKVDVGVQTLPRDSEELKEESLVFLCNECKSRTYPTELLEADDKSDMQLVPIDESHSAEKSKQQVPKAVEKVLAGAIRREMALEEQCAKQKAEIMQLNRLIMQYKHERECSAVIGQTREDKIIRLESLMDGVLPTEEFMEEEFLSLTNELKILKGKYDNHPEVLRAKIDLKRVQDELDSYRNFFDMGERDVLIEEIQSLRSQLQYYLDSPSPVSARKRSPVLQLTHTGEPCSAPLAMIPESTEESAEDKFEQERLRWIEAESNWISLSEELRTELETNRTLAKKQKKELDSEKKCSEELKEALQMAMQGHARMLEQYADLEEKHMELLARHRKIQDGIEDVKRAAAKAGVKGAESRFINSLAAEVSALRVAREKERRYFMDENKGLQAQLRDTAEAVQAAGELLVRLKEAEEAAGIAQKRASDAEQEAEKAYKQIANLKKKHEREITTLNHFLAESRLPKEALLRPACDDSDMVKYDVGESNKGADGEWRDEFEPFYHGEDGELSRLTEPSSWFSGYDRCNI